MAVMVESAIACNWEIAPNQQFPLAVNTINLTTPKYLYSDKSTLLSTHTVYANVAAASVLRGAADCQPGSLTVGFCYGHLQLPSRSQVVSLQQL